MPLRLLIARLRAPWVALALCGAAAVAHSAPPAGADELAALPGGGWLAIDGDGLALFDASGALRDRVKLRAEALDVRATPRQALAVLMDANTQQVLPLRVDLVQQRLTPLPALPAAGHTLSALCLYRDAQDHDHVFVIAENGLARQWVLRGDAALAVRDLAVAPGVERCRVDDHDATLYVSEPGGVWAHRADPEGAPTRAVVALARPHGALLAGGGPLAVLPGGVSVGDAGAGALRLLAGSAQRGAWRSVARVALPRGSEPDQLALAHDGRALWVRDDGAGSWSRHALPAGAPRAAAAPPRVPTVQALAQTDPVISLGDAADDPAIWVHPLDRSRSRVLGTDKTRGLGVYDLQGREQQFLPIGRLNNVDLRQAVRVGGATVDIAAATHRDDPSVVIFTVDADGRLSEAGRIPADLPDIYGLCLYRTADGALDVIANDKSGRFLQWRLETLAPRVTVRLRREFRVATQPEGCVADDRAARLFVGEEDRGIWTLPAEPVEGAAARLTMVLPVGPQLVADVEGLAVYDGVRGRYLVASSQGDNRYVVLDAAPPFALRGSFRVAMNLAEGIDGVSETDGLELLSGAFGPLFPDGLLVVQDGFKRLPEGPQNYKYVSWADVMRALGLD